MLMAGLPSGPQHPRSAAPQVCGERRERPSPPADDSIFPRVSLVAITRYGWSPSGLVKSGLRETTPMRECPETAAMSADQDTPRGRRSLGTDRLAAFSDGVLAIAATLLVLDIVVQPPGTLLQQVLRAWPGYLAYAVSFLTIGGTWLVHTALTDRL